MDALADGEVTPSVLPVWLAVDRALGRGGRTHDTDIEIAERYGLGLSGRTVRRYLSRLVDLGYVIARRCADGSRMLHRPTLLSDPLAKTAGSSWPDLPGLGGASRAPERELAPEQSSSSALADGRHLGDAHVSDDAAAKTDDHPPESTPSPPPQAPPTKKKRSWKQSWGGGASEDPTVAWVLSGLAEEYRTGPHRQWTRKVAVLIREATTTDQPGRPALTPIAARYAMTHLTDPDSHGGRTVPAAREALRLMAYQTRAGLACRDCGHDDRPMAHGRCIDCTPEHTPNPETLASIPASERRALYASLGLDPDDAGPPEATEEAHSGANPDLGGECPESAERGSVASADASAGIAACWAALTGRGGHE